MCEFSGKLVAWLDHEIDHQEAAAFKQHLENCLDCRKSLAVYTDLNARLADYCDAVFAGASKQRRAWWPMAGSAIGAVAAAALLVFLIPRAATNRIPPQPAPSVQAPVMARQTSPVPVQTIRRRRTRRVIRTQSAEWQPPATDIQIAIPAEAIFPPGALPEGFQFIADLSIAADGSPQGLRIIP